MPIEDSREKIVSKFRIEDKSLLRELLAEMIGTFMLVVSESIDILVALPPGLVYHSFDYPGHCCLMLSATVLSTQDNVAWSCPPKF